MKEQFLVRHSDRKHRIDLLKEGDGFVVGTEVSLTAIAFCHGVIDDFVFHYEGRFPIDWVRVIRQVGKVIVSEFLQPRTFEAVKNEQRQAAGADCDEKQLEIQSFFAWTHIFTSVFYDTDIDTALQGTEGVSLMDEDKAYLSEICTLYALGVADLSFLPCEVFSKETLMMWAAKKVIQFEGGLFDDCGEFHAINDGHSIEKLCRDFEGEKERKLVATSLAIRRVRERGGLRKKEDWGQVIADEAKAIGVTKKSGKPFSPRACNDWKRMYFALSEKEKARIDMLAAKRG